jgi:hypothetical protein
MKIFSNFKDYYDHVQAFGQDEDVSYIRATKTYCDPYRNHSYFRNNNKWDSRYVWYKVILDGDGRETLVHRDPEEHIITHAGWGGNVITVHFCGKVYYAIEHNVHSTLKKEYFYDPAKYEKWFNETNRSRYDRYYLKSELELLASNGKVDQRELNKINRTPIILIKKTYEGLYNIHNPRLNVIEFQKVVDPYTAFMELDMFLSGVLGKTGGDMVTISDKDKIDKHGFDMQYGFRTRPKGVSA